MTILTEGRGMELVYAPVVVCDWCGKTCLCDGNSMAAWDAGGSGELYHAHKGRCLDAIEERIGLQPGCIYTSELAAHLAYLTDNSQLTSEHISKTRKNELA